MTTIAYLVCWGSFWALLYIYVGYPVLVWLWARLWPRPVRKQSYLPTVSVIIVVRDGVRHIRSKLKNLRALDYPPEYIEIIVACDGCTDRTAALVRHAHDPRARVMDFPVPRGKALCLNDAVATARGDVLLMTDVQHKLSPLALRELVDNLGDLRVGAVSGSLDLENVHSAFAHGVNAYWRYEKFIRTQESRCASAVGASHALYAVRRDLFQPLPPDTLLDDVLLPMRVAAAGHRVVFEPRAVVWGEPAQDPLTEQPRRLQASLGCFQLMELAPWLLSPSRNPLWFQFVSHKLLRLLAPWLLLSLLLSSAFLARHHQAYAAVLVALLLAMALVPMERLRPHAGRWLPVRLMVAFFYLNLYAAQASIAFARSRGEHPW
ncbi:glycosyltransferase family 2 protein [Dyella jiangningensis]|uniref:glycosyltransferase family 2 protein n=1 Tax=Dyella jiangningensis TaxID=1379159 RepID=UPI001EDEC20D|nr:glycosyltransferase family 2 protein [Dyella jiangningensis]